MRSTGSRGIAYTSCIQGHESVEANHDTCRLAVRAHLGTGDWLLGNGDRGWRWRRRRMEAVEVGAFAFVTVVHPEACLRFPRRPLPLECASLCGARTPARTQFGLAIGNLRP